MNEVKIQIPDNCELIKDGDTYIVKEKKQGPPRSWEEFCERYPIRAGESYLMSSDRIFTAEEDYSSKRLSRIWCTSEKEASAFLALIQLRQLRKAWVGDWEPSRCIEYSVILVEKRANRFEVGYGYWDYNRSMTFPTKEMAEYFLNCFKDLCETAKILL